jgi:acyl-CoA thioester hydrolase
MTTPARPGPAPARSAFRHLLETDVRFSDCDVNGHVNNAVYATYFEYGRTLFILDPKFGAFDTEHEVILARIVIDYRRELTWPNRIAVGTAVAGLGTSSVLITHAVFQGETCIATGECTLVRIRKDTRKGAAWPQAAREAFEGNRLAG